MKHGNYKAAFLLASFYEPSIYCVSNSFRTDEKRAKSLYKKVYQMC